MSQLLTKAYQYPALLKTIRDEIASAKDLIERRIDKHIIRLYT